MQEFPGIEKLWLAVQQSASTVVITDLQGRIEFVNPRFCELSGYTIAEAVGQNPRILKSGLTPAERYDEMWSTISRGEDWQGEVLNRRKDGSLYWANLHISPIKDASGVLTGFLGVEEDVSTRKTLENGLQRANAELLRSNEDLRQFSTMIAHDVRAPLDNICGFLEVLLEAEPDVLETNARELVELALASAKHAQGFSSELLRFARIGFDANTKSLTSLNYCLTTALATISDLIVRRGVQIERQALPEVHACGTLISQVFQNLIENAIKYCANTPLIKISARLGDGEWIFSVTDNGLGIESEVLPQVFQPFARFHGRTVAHGNGLGLAACKRIVELHGGRIWLESKVGEGSTFYFSIPHIQNTVDTPLVAAGESTSKLCTKQLTANLEANIFPL